MPEKTFIIKWEGDAISWINENNMKNMITGAIGVQVVVEELGVTKEDLKGIYGDNRPNTR